MNEVVYFKSGHGRKTFTIVHGLEKGHASPDLTGAKSHQKMMASLLDTYQGFSEIQGNSLNH